MALTFLCVRKSFGYFKTIFSESALNATSSLSAAFLLTSTKKHANFHQIAVIREVFYYVQSVVFKVINQTVVSNN